MEENKEKKQQKGTLPTGVTDEMIKAWKDRYGQNKIKMATLTCDDGSFDPFDVVIRVPDRVTMGEFEKWLERKPDKAKEIVVKACLLTGKEEVLANDDKFMAAFTAIAEILPVQKALIKNL